MDHQCLWDIGHHPLTRMMTWNVPQAFHAYRFTFRTATIILPGIASQRVARMRARLREAIHCLHGDRFFTSPHLRGEVERSSLLLIPPSSGEGRPQRSGGRGGGNVRMRSLGQAPTRHIVSLRSRCATLPTRGRDEDPRCGCSVQNDIAR
jgi:hypothetical protein